MRDIVERLELQAFVADKIQSGMKPLIMDCLDEITRLRAENEKLREALKPFAYNYQNNGLSHSTFMFAMKDLLAAKKALEATDD